MTTKSVIINALALCLVVFALSGCSSEVLMEEMSTEGNTGANGSLSLSVGSIDTQGISPEVTRGTSYNSAAELTSMGLFALRYAVGTNPSAAAAGDYIYNDALVYNATEQEWDSHYSWPGAANRVSLFAYAPYSDQDVADPPSGMRFSAGSVTGSPKLYYTVPDDADQNPDIIVATKTNLSGDSYRAEPMDFDHICARVRVVFINGMAERVRFRYVNDYGVYTFGSGWNTVGKSESKSEVVHQFDTPTYSSCDDPIELTFFFPPQTVPNDAQLEVNYQGQEAAQISTEPAGAVWEAGKTYTYYIYASSADFAAEAKPQIFVAPLDGTYTCECWGSTGGAYGDRSQLQGYGAYTKGDITLSKGDTLYVYCGDWYFNDYYTFNGGGAGEQPGGGATDIRLKGGNWDDYESLISRIMVAAGGGGAFYYIQVRNITSRGHAGGLNGYDAVCVATTDNKGNYGGKGASQTVGGAAGTPSSTRLDVGTLALKSGSFGKGGFGLAPQGSSCSSGGGGGYYGGGHGIHPGNTHTGGGGGSSFISGHGGCVALAASSENGTLVHKSASATDASIHYSGKYFTNTVMFDGAGYEWLSATKGRVATATGFPAPDGHTEYGHSGSGTEGLGYARITYNH